MNYPNESLKAQMELCRDLYNEAIEKVFYFMNQNKTTYKYKVENKKEIIKWQEQAKMYDTKRNIIYGQYLTSIGAVIKNYDN